MGLQNVVKDFCSWCDNVKNIFSDIVGPLIPSNPDVTGKTFLSTIIDTFPDEYRHMLDYEPYYTYTWLNWRWRVMLQPQERTRNGFVIRMPLVSIDNIPQIDLDDLNPFFYECKPLGEDELTRNYIDVPF